MKPIVSRKQFLALHHEGLTGPEIAERLRCTTRTVGRLRKQYGFTKPVRNRPRTAEDLARFGAMLDDGWSFAEIIRTEGTTNDFLKKHFPGRQWSHVQCGKHARMLSKLGGAA